MGRPFFRNCKLNKMRAATEMLRITPSQCLGPAAPKQFIERSNKFFDLNQQKYVEYEIEINKKANEKERNDDLINDDGYNDANMANTAINGRKRMRIIQDIK